MLGNKIVLSDKPRGVWREGKVNGAMYPGTIVQLDVSAGRDDNGRYTYEPATPGADGARTTIMVLVPTYEWGDIKTDVIADGELCRIYIPPVGEELNVLLKDVTGTGDTHAFGDLYGVENGTGLVIADSSFAHVPFQLLEDLDALTADTLAHVMVVDKS